MKHLDLFSGFGGFALGLERASFETVAFCEIEEYPRKVLAKHWPDVPIYKDIRELTGERLRADGIVPDIITGGYPCQPFSQAGKRQGEADDRHLWPEMFRLIQECRPAWVLGENVVGHISMGLDDVLSDLEAEDYTCQAFIVPACAVDAPHRRDRVWIVAHTERPERRSSEPAGYVGDGANAGRSETASRAGTPSQDGDAGAMANATSERRNSPGSTGQAISQPGTLERSAGRGSSLADAARKRRKQPWSPRSRRFGFENDGAGSGATDWLPEPGVGRLVDGLPNRVDRLKGLGNAVVPQIPELIGRAIMAAHEQTRSTS